MSISCASGLRCILCAEGVKFGTNCQRLSNNGSGEEEKQEEDARAAPLWIRCLQPEPEEDREEEEQQQEQEGRTRREEGEGGREDEDEEGKRGGRGGARARFAGRFARRVSPGYRLAGRSGPRSKLTRAKRTHGEANWANRDPGEHESWTLRTHTTRDANLHLGHCEPTQRALQTYTWGVRTPTQRICAHAHIGFCEGGRMVHSFSRVTIRELRVANHA